MHIAMHVHSRASTYNASSTSHTLKATIDSNEVMSVSMSMTILATKATIDSKVIQASGIIIVFATH